VQLCGIYIPHAETVGWCKYFVTTEAANLKTELWIKYGIDLSTRCSGYDYSGGCRSAGVVAKIQSMICGHGDREEDGMNLRHKKILCEPAEAVGEGGFSNLRTSSVN
jgi:hypothetical protein